MKINIGRILTPLLLLMELPIFQKLHRPCFELIATMNLKVAKYKLPYLIGNSLVSAVVICGNILYFMRNSCTFVQYVELVCDTAILAYNPIYVSILIRNKDKVQSYTDFLLSPYPEGVPSLIRCKIVNKFKAQCTLNSMVIILMFIYSIQLYFVPLLDILFSSDKTFFTHLSLPIGKLPWPQDSVVVFWFWYLASAISISLAMRNYFCVISSHLCTYTKVTSSLQLLRLKLKLMDDTDSLRYGLRLLDFLNSTQLREVSKSSDLQLKECIVHHNEIIR